jgi:microcystin-dependent protein
MARQIFANNASSLLATSISDLDTIIQVEVGFGTFFPSPGASEYFIVTLENSAGDIEVCRCTSRTGDLLTVVRGQEGTPAAAWTGGLARVELRNTKGSMEVFLQREGDAMTGPLDMQTNEVQNAVLATPDIQGGTTEGTVLKASDGGSGNEIVIPDGGGAPTVGGSPMVLGSTPILPLFPTGAIIMWYGALGSVPGGWQLCDGTNGTPDLRDKFVVGAGGAYAPDATGGEATTNINVSTGADGGHDHGALTGAEVLTASMIPVHSHTLYGNSSSGSFGNTQGLGNVGAKVAGEGGGTAAYMTVNGSGTQLIGNSTGGTDPHDHSIAAEPDHTHTVTDTQTNLPPYYAIYYIMKV